MQVCLEEKAAAQDDGQADEPAEPTPREEAAAYRHAVFGRSGTKSTRRVRTVFEDDRAWAALRIREVQRAKGLRTPTRGCSRERRPAPGHRRGSRRGAAATRAGPDADSDSDPPPGELVPQAWRATAGRTP